MSISKPVAILLGGKSIARLPDYIQDLKDKVTFVGMNNFLLTEELLKPINESFNAIAVFSEEELVARKGPIEDFLRRPNVSLITSIESLHAVNWGNRFANTFKDKIYFQENIMFSGGVYPNTLTVLLFALNNIGYERTIIFGCDGIGKETDIQETYYKKETYGKRNWNLIEDTVNFNNNFGDIFPKDMSIVNCNPNSYIYSFHKIDYPEIKDWLANEKAHYSAMNLQDSVEDAAKTEVSKFAWTIYEKYKDKAPNKNGLKSVLPL